MHLPLWLCNDAEGAVVVGCLAGAEGSHGDGCLAVAAVERSGVAAGIAVVGGGAARSASGVGEGPGILAGQYADFAGGAGIAAVCSVIGVAADEGPDILAGQFDAVVEGRSIPSGQAAVVVDKDIGPVATEAVLARPQSVDAPSKCHPEPALSPRSGNCCASQ